MQCDCCFMDCPKGHHMTSTQFGDKLELWCTVCDEWIGFDDWVPNVSGDHWVW